MLSSVRRVSWNCIRC